MHRTSIACGFALTITQVALGQRPDTLAREVVTRPAGSMTISPDRTPLVAGTVARAMDRITAVAPGSGGTVFVVDEVACVVRQLSADGRLIREIGGRGSGPGEFLGPTDAVLLTGGRLAVYDPAARRIVTFDTADGRPEHHLTGLLPGMRLGRRFARDGSRGFLVETIEPPHPRDPSPGVHSTLIVRIDARGVVVDTARVVRYALSESSIWSTGAGRAGQSVTRSAAVPFVPRPLWDIGGDGMWVTGTPSTYELRVGGAPPNRAAVVALRRDGQPRVAVRPEEATDWEGWTRQRMSGAAWNGPRIPAVKPFFAALTIDVDRRIWVRVSSEAAGYDPRGNFPGARWPEPNVYDIVEADGRLLGRVSLPHGTVFLTARGDFAWFSRENADGTVQLSSYRLSVR